MLHFYKEVFSLRYHFGPRFRILHWCTDQMITGALAQMELTSSQGRIMGYIAHRKEPPCARDLEEQFHLSHPSVSGILSRLEKKGFIEFRPDESDRRCKRIYILPKGIECHARMEQSIADTEQQITAGFTPEECKQFSALLDRAIKNMGGTCCPPCKEEKN